jgi:hypothetical protein
VFQSLIGSEQILEDLLPGRGMPVYNDPNHQAIKKAEGNG